MMCKESGVSDVRRTLSVDEIVSGPASRGNDNHSALSGGRSVKESREWRAVVSSSWEHRDVSMAIIRRLGERASEPAIHGNGA